MNKYGKKSIGLLLAGISIVSIMTAPVEAKNNFPSLYRTDRERGCSMPTGIDEEMMKYVEKSSSEEARLFEKSISKTVKKTYANRNSVPAALNYQEYIDGAWYGGNLPLIEVRYLKGSGLYEATFSGKLYLQ